MSTSVDYFVNHERARHFPWSLYHAPLERNLRSFLRRVAKDYPKGHVLVVGCGLLHELEAAPEGLRFTVADIDQRALDAVSARSDPRICAAVAVRPEEPISLGQRFCAAYAKEVVEHVIAWPAWLTSLRHALVPDGRLWLSTPNYGEPWLGLLEATVLEVVARKSGFSRHGLHPTRFSKGSLAEGLRRSGFREVEVRTTTMRLALTAWARCPSQPVSSARRCVPGDAE